MDFLNCFPVFLDEKVEIKYDLYTGFINLKHEISDRANSHG